MNITDIDECALGRALRDIREESRQAAIDWSRIPLGQFFEGHARELAERRKSNDGSSLMRVKWIERARMMSRLAKRRWARP